MLYRLRTTLGYQYFRLATRGIERTPPLPVPAAADCEIHTMLGAHDLRMYTLAIKSLVSFVTNVSVVVHSDGSLQAEHTQMLQQHLPGLRLVEHGAADDQAARALADRPLLREWRAHDAAYRRLMDVELSRRAERVVILDSDVLTNARPDEVIQWVEGSGSAFLLGQPPATREDLEGAPPPGAHVQRQFLSRVPALSARLGYPATFLQGTTAGFCGYTHEISLSNIETALRESLALGLPMEQWGGDQCLVIYLLSVGGAERLPASRYLNFEPSIADRAEDAKMIHFYGTHRFARLTYPRLAAAAVKRLRS